MKDKRIRAILKTLPIIRKLIRAGYKWDVLKGICEPLGLNDTSFRDNPNLKTYLVSYKYWRKRLK